MIIQHNIMALNSYNKLSGNNSAVQKNLEKLSSGYRINKAGDDAAGLAISEKMRAQITGLERAKLNAQDGISLVQTAEGALTEVHSMLNRLVELGTESANGVYQADDRQRIQDEVDQTIEEINRISDATNFNGINLLDGSLGNTSGGKSGGLVGSTVVKYKAATTTKAYANASSFVAAEETYIINNTKVTVDWSKLSDEEKGLLKQDFTNATSTQKEAAAKLMETKINEAITAAGGSEGVKIIADGASGFTITSALSGTTNSALQVSSSVVVSGVASMLLGLTTAAVTAAAVLVPQTADINGKFTISIDGEDFEVAAPTVTGAANLVNELQTALNTALLNYDTAKGLTGTDKAMMGSAGNVPKIKVKLNESGQLEFVNNSGKKISFSDQDGKEFAKGLGISTDGKVMSGGLTLQVGDTADDFNKVTVSVDDMSAAGLGLSAMKVTDQGISMESVEKVKAAINKVSENRGRLGALQNRLEHTINNLSTTTENMTAAESRIRDTDMAKEMMNFTKNNVLVQAAQAMLSQANQQPQQVLQLLR